MTAAPHLREPPAAGPPAADPPANQSLTTEPLASAPSPCQSCGACCAYSPDWPRFSTESDAALDLIPANLVDASLSRMAWTGTCCAAFCGEVGKHTACTIYEIRPEVCRACEPGDDACNMARAKYQLAPIVVA